MRGRREAVENTWIQSERKAVDEGQIDLDRFQARYSSDWWQPVRSMAVWRHSIFVYIFATLVAFVFIYLLTWLIRMRLWT